MSKLEFHIEKSIKSGDTDLAALTIEETNALIEILSALRNIAVHEFTKDIKIGVINESACALMDAEPETMDYIHLNILKVVHNEKDRDNVYVENLLKIREQVCERKFEMKIVYRRNDDEVKDIKDYFEKTFHKRRPFKKRESSFILEFLEGEIKKSGENSGHWVHFIFETKGIRIPILCSESQASVAGKFLFKNNSKISAWGRIDNKSQVHYTCADIYLEGTDEDYYSDLRNYFANFFKLTEVERIKSIHNRLKEYYRLDMLGHAKKFIRLFLYDEVEVGYLLSILVLTKNYIKREELSPLLKDAEKILSNKNKGALL
ncbi:hypothetical protein SAMN02927916_0003 [Flavobacterium anhuiense]|uniref:Uncharacterized protein n=1 Tax=Flavobacterium anhuiense TaxID=459526 RepID=A0ABY0M4K2_9FLAO|nr:hypothetical protein [Flavobacterium anhuiense]SCZ00170.1 hypothetical protein SAMN02927916_0003 [Flavobacterium anhuiense]